MLDRFQGESGKRLLIEAIAGQKIVAGNKKLAEELANHINLVLIELGSFLIEQGNADNDVFFILTGSFDVVVNGRSVAKRGSNDHVGEISAIDPSQKRSASVVALEQSVVAKISEDDFNKVASKFPEIYRFISKELAGRLTQRNSMVITARESIRVFIICSVEALTIARAVQNAFSHDPFTTVIWSDGVFKVTNYTLQSLEDEVDNSDFAVAIAHSDDIVNFRGDNWPAPRDNVIFELGLFMGRLGKNRAILMEPRDEGIKLPSDLAGITTIPYRYEKENSDLASLIGPACNILRDHINSLGPNN